MLGRARWDPKLGLLCPVVHVGQKAIASRERGREISDQLKLNEVIRTRIQAREREEVFERLLLCTHLQACRRRHEV